MGHTPVGATAALAAVGGYAALYRLGQTWGATGEERQQPLAGDELLPDARAWTTHAITTRRPHMRSGRGWCRWAGDGRLVHLPLGRPACSRPTAPANRILPEHQRLREGDHVPDGPPAADCWFTVDARAGPAAGAAVDPAPAVVGASAGWRWTGSGAGTREPIGGCTRVIQRNRMRLHPWWFERAFLGTIVPADFVMARSHLRLQRRAEAAAARRPPPGHWPDSGVPTGNPR